MSRNKIFVGIIILAFIAVVGFYIYRDFSLIKDASKMEDSGENLEKLLNGGDNENNQDFVLKEEKNESGAGIKIPDLSKPVVIKADLPQDIKDDAVKEIEVISNTLKQDYRSIDAWIQLGLLRKLLGDYDGAKEAWEFAATIAPGNFTAFHNLGFIYWQYYKDYTKAEQNYLKAIKNNPRDTLAYIDLSNIYYYDLKNPAKARSILMDGLKANPEDQELLRALRDMNL